MRNFIPTLLILLMALASDGSSSLAQNNQQQATADKAAKCDQESSDKCAWLGVGSRHYYNCWGSKYVDCIRR